jgi:excinuclease UvrABC nuclease subunit
VTEDERLESLSARIAGLPEQPGIYFLLDSAGKTLYVGKAKSLRKRVASYLARELEPRLQGMLAEAADVDYVVSGTEQEALLLENDFIKQRKPRYNVLLRDDKTYPYLKLTKEPWPRLVFTRRIRDDGADYFGPYLPGGLARRAVKLAQKLCGIRVCKIEIDGSLARLSSARPVGVVNKCGRAVVGSNSCSRSSGNSTSMVVVGGPSWWSSRSRAIEYRNSTSR